MNTIRLILLPFLLLPACQPAPPPPDPVGPIPSSAQLAWHEMERNVFIHFGMNTFTNKEWGYGDESPASFAPTAFDPDQWASLFAEVGFKGLILTAKHHDGFCLWPSSHTGHSVENSPWRDGDGDVVREVAEACARHGLSFGLYLSPWDRNHPGYGTPAYLSYYRSQCEELITTYGPIFELWVDGAQGGDGYYGGARERRTIDSRTYYDWPRTIQLVRDLSPATLLFSDAGPDIRWCGNEQGIGGLTNWNTLTPDTLFPGKSGIGGLLASGSENGTAWIPAEVNTSIRPGWFYHPEEDSLVKTPQQLFDLYLTSVGRGSMLLLNIPPDTRGLIHEQDAAALRGWKELLDEQLSSNLALQAEAVASSVRGNAARFEARNVIDEDWSTYWTTDDTVTTGSVTLDLGTEQTISFVMLQEYFPLGQRISSFRIDTIKDGEWEAVADGTTIGYKRILPVPQVRSRFVRVTVERAKASPLLSTVAVY